MKRLLLTLSLFSIGARAVTPSQAETMKFLSGISNADAGQIPLSNGVRYVPVAPSGAFTMSPAGVATLATGGILTASLGAASVTAAKLATSSLTEANVITQAADGLNIARVARATYDFAVNGGAVSAIDLGVTLPAKSVITNSLMEIVTPIVSTNNDGTFAVSCEDANNIFTATDIDGQGALSVLKGTALPSAPVGGIAAACNITASIAVHAFTAGKVIIWVYYVVGE